MKPYPVRFRSLILPVLVVGALVAHLSTALAAPLSPEKVARLEGQLDAKRMMAHVRYLSQTIGDRHEGSAKERRTAHYIAGQFQKWGYSVRFEKFPLPDGSISQNVIARKGERPGDKFFVMGAHYDSRQGCPAANDNASGVGALLETARVLRDVPHVAVEFIAFGAEDRWEAHYRENAHRLNGSRFHVAHLSGQERKRITGMISLDMLGVGRVLQIGALRGSRNAGSSRLNALLLREAYALRIPNERFKTRPWSDHVWFDRAGIPAVWMWWYFDPLFDTPRDVMARLDRDKMRSAAQVALRGMLNWPLR